MKNKMLASHEKSTKPVMTMEKLASIFPQSKKISLSPDCTVAVVDCIPPNEDFSELISVEQYSPCKTMPVGYVINYQKTYVRYWKGSFGDGISFGKDNEIVIRKNKPESGEFIVYDSGLVVLGVIKLIADSSHSMFHNPVMFNMPIDGRVGFVLEEASGAHIVHVLDKNYQVQNSSTILGLHPLHRSDLYYAYIGNMKVADHIESLLDVSPIDFIGRR